MPETSRHKAPERARHLALGHDNSAMAALLLDIGDDEAAEAMLLAELARVVRADNPGARVPLAQGGIIAGDGCWLGNLVNLGKLPDLLVMAL